MGGKLEVFCFLDFLSTRNSPFGAIFNCPHSCRKKVKKERNLSPIVGPISMLSNSWI